MGERTTVIGTILAVVFQNEENGYTVARIVTDDGEPVTVVGCIPCAAPGEELILTGRYTTHPQHGEQFAADEVERHMPTGETEILNYLASGVVRGIGPATAQKLVDRFGADTLDVLDGEPEKLKTIKGITDKRAREIAESWRELAGLRRVLDFLTKYDLPVGLAMQLFRRYGADAMDALRRNPYLLSGEAFGVDFSVSDEIALSMGFSGDSSCRTEAGVLFELSHNEQSGGHVFLPREKLVAATAQLLDGDTDTVEKALDDLLERGSVVQEQVANVEGCYLRRCHEAETYVCTRVRAMLADKPDKLRGAKKIIDEIERGQGIEYAPLQRQAVELAAQEELLILTGGPGTGKTTSVRGIVALFERMGLDVLLCAPTGRAAKRMGELCGKEAQTIHRLLGMSWNEQTGDVTFTKNEKEPLEADAVIVDETSMVDLALMRALLAALRPGCRLVLVRDPDQLPSVGAGNVFGDLIRSERVATVALKDIFRQAEQSAIVRSAHLVNEGQLPELQNTAASDFFFLPRRDSARLVDTVVELCRTRLPEKMHIPAESIQVLTATRKGDTGTAVRNLQQALKNKGYYSGSVDGKYGAATTAAVVAFQSAQGLRVDGKAGPATQRALFTTSSSTDTSKYTTLRPGDSGAAIRQLQTTLKQKGYYTGTIDGDYGSGTTAAVKAFQKKMNITPVDGIAGDKTLTLLYSSDAVDSDEYATLRPGDTGAAVRTMQATLYELGYYDGSRDGVYGATTQDAVRAFQIRNKVTPVDGIAGNKTLTKLYSGTAVAAAAKTTEYKTLRKGDRGDEVVQMQDSLQQLGYLASVTGYYDDATVAAVRSFQSRNGLSVDGSAGQETLAVLYGSNPRAAY